MRRIEHLDAARLIPDPSYSTFDSLTPDAGRAQMAWVVPGRDC